MKKSILGLVLGCATIFGSAADAGANYNDSVYIYHFSDGSAEASGGLRSTRSTTDFNQYIGCEVGAGSNSSVGYVSCFASDTSGNYLWCWFTSPSQLVVQTVSSISEASTVEFNQDSSNHCTGVYVSNTSTAL